MMKRKEITVAFIPVYQWIPPMPWTFLLQFGPPLLVDPELLLPLHQEGLVQQRQRGVAAVTMNALVIVIIGIE
jgi:hypothetical protein